MFLVSALTVSCCVCAAAAGQSGAKGVAAAKAASPFRIGVPQKPVPRDRHTLLLATFDSASSGSADYARFDAINTGRKTKHGVEGRFGGAVRFAELQSSIVYRGTSGCTSKTWSARGSTRPYVSRSPAAGKRGTSGPRCGPGSSTGPFRTPMTSARIQRHQIVGHGGPTLNDDAHGRSMEDMLVLYHVTHDTKYLDALRRAGDWLAEKAFVRKDASCGWAEQYDMSSQPCWGRHMEPPAVSMTATGDAVPRLLLLYDLTADPKYLKPVEQCLAWGRALPEQRPGWLYYDLESGEPVMAYEKRIFSVFSEEFKQQFPKFSAHFSSGRAGYPFDNYAAWLKQRAPGPTFPAWKGTLPRRSFGCARPSREELLARAQSWPAGSVKALEDWQAGKLGEILINLDEYAALMFDMSTAADHAANLLDAIAVARCAAGDVPVESFPHYSRAALGNAALIDPGRDWYDTPLGPTEKLVDSTRTAVASPAGSATATRTSPLVALLPTSRRSSSRRSFKRGVERDDARRRARRLETGIQHLLGLEGDLAPVRIRLARQRQLGELPEHVGLLRVLGAVAVLRHRDPARVLFHVKVATADVEGWLQDVERHFAPEVRKHEIRHVERALGPADLSPLLVRGSK
jgi:hypothetical protein